MGRAVTVTLALIDARQPIAYELHPAVRVVPLGPGGIPGLAVSWWRFRRLAKQAQVVCSFLDLANVLAALSVSRRVRLVWSARSNGVPTKRRSRLVFTAARWLSFRAHCIVANAEPVRTFYEDADFRPDTFTVVPNAVDLNRFCPDGSARLHVRQELGIAQEAPVLIAVARAHPDKRHDLMVECVARLRAQFPELVLVCIGDGVSSDTRLAAVVEQHGLTGCVRRLDARPEVQRFINACDLAVNLSDREGLPNSLIEAMACGLPCVATRVGGVGNLLQDVGMLVDAGDVEGACAAISGYLDDSALRREHGDAGRQRVAQRYAIEPVVDLFERALGVSSAGEAGGKVT